MIRSILKTSTFQQSQITIFGTIINGILGFLFYILIARFLGPAEFGLLVVSITTLTLIADIADFGTNAGLIRFVSANLHTNYEKAYRFLKLSLEVKFFVWIVIMMLSFFLSEFVATFFFNKPQLSQPLKLVSIGVGGALFFSFATSALQSFQKFFLWSVVNITTNFFRLILICLLFFQGLLNLSNGLITYITLPFFGFLLTLFFLPTKKIMMVSNEKNVVYDFFKFNRWVAIFTIIAAISSRLDTFLTARLLSNFEIGIYGAANQIVSIIPQIVGALGVVIAPKFASFRNNNQMIIYLKKTQLLVSGLVVFGLLSIPVAIYFLPYLYGFEYYQTIMPFVILLLAMLVFLLSVPVHNSIIYYFGKPEVFVWVSFCHLLIISLLGYFMISYFGVVGASISVLAGTIFNFFAPLIWLLKKIHEKS